MAQNTQQQYNDSDSDTEVEYSDDSTEASDSWWDRDDEDEILEPFLWSTMRILPPHKRLTTPPINPPVAKKFT